MVSAFIYISELGHNIGLQHVAGADNVMSAVNAQPVWSSETIDTFASILSTSTCFDNQLQVRMPNIFVIVLDIFGLKSC